MGCMTVPFNGDLKKYHVLERQSKRKTQKEHEAYCLEPNSKGSAIVCPSLPYYPSQRSGPTSASPASSIAKLVMQV